MKTVVPAAALFVLLLGACEPDPRTAPDPGQSPASGPISVSTDDRLLLIASEDHGALLIVDRLSKALLGRVEVGAGASHVLVLDAARAAVTSRYAHNLSIVDVNEHTVITQLQVGVEPMGMAQLDGGRLAVALAGEQALAVVDIDAGEVVQKIALPAADPRAVARLRDGSLYVTHMTAGVLSRVYLDDERVETVDARTRNDFGPQIHPNHLRSLTLTLAGDRAVIAHSQSNAETVRAPIETEATIVEDEFGGGGNCGYSGCPQQLGAVVPAVTEIDTDEDVVVVPARRDAGDSTQTPPFGGIPPESTMEDCFDCGFFPVSAPNPSSVLNPFEARFGGLSLNNPTAVALLDGGRALAVVNMGSKNLLLLRRPLRGTADDVIGVVRLGNGASGITVSHDGRNLYVWNQFDGSVTDVEVPVVDTLEDQAQSRFVVDATGESTAAEFREVVEFSAVTDVVVEDALDPEPSLGRKLFHDATDSRISVNHAISCASCHPDGRSDGRTWQFTFGARNTPQLGGGILDTAPFHWPGDVATPRELDTMTVRAFMGGTGLDAASLDAIGAFIDTIPAPAPADTLGTTDEQVLAIQRGEALFYSDALGCGACHAGRHGTDNASWDIDSAQPFEVVRAYQTPVLHGLARTAPYLHDGSQATLEDLVDNWVRTDRMGQGSQLSDSEARDLVAFLKSL